MLVNCPLNPCNRNACSAKEGVRICNATQTAYLHCKFNRTGSVCRFTSTRNNAPYRLAEPYHNHISFARNNQGPLLHSYDNIIHVVRWHSSVPRDAKTSRETICGCKEQFVHVLFYEGRANVSRTRIHSDRFYLSPPRRLTIGSGV